MKKIIAILCLLALCLPLMACAKELQAEAVPAATQTSTKEEEKGPIVYPKGVFSVGYSIGDITCTTPLPIYNGTAHQATLRIGYSFICFKFAKIGIFLAQVF